MQVPLCHLRRISVTLAKRVNSNIMNWNPYSLVIIQVGTNNVDNDDTPDDTMTDMLDLFDNIEILYDRQ